MAVGTMAFAKTGDVVKNNVKTEKKAKWGTSCTVRVTSGGYDVKITVNCKTCTTTKQACDKAYAIASIAV